MFSKPRVDENGNPIPLTEAEKKEQLKNCIVCKKEDAPPIVWRVESVPTARLVDKFARNNAITVCKSGVDPDAKRFWYEKYVNVYTTEMVSFSYEEVAAEFGWKELKFSDNQQTVYPTWLTE